MVIDLVLQVGRLERHLVEQPLHHGVQPAGADVLGALVDDAPRTRAIVADAVVGERQVDALGRHQRDVLLDQRAARLGEDAHELRLRRARSSSTRIGKRPCSSGIRSDGFETWNAPAAMNRM